MFFFFLKKGNIFLDWLVIRNVQHCLPFDIYRVRKLSFRSGRGDRVVVLLLPSHHLYFSSDTLSYLSSYDHFTSTN